MSNLNLTKIARQAISSGTSEHKNDTIVVDPNSNDNTANSTSISIAKIFLKSACTKFLDSNLADDDRLVKIGRSLVDLVNAGRLDDDGDQKLEASLALVVEQCEILATKGLKVPKVRFGKTNIEMPIVTLGCMRFQQAWGDSITNIDQVDKKCQDNLVSIFRRAIDLGINHIETARGYGCSEIQLGQVFTKLFEDGEVKREDLIIQTKVNPSDSKTFRATLEKSFKNLRLDYIDLFSFHGLNMDSHYDRVFNNGDDENLMDVIREYQAAGKIRHVGFSTHGRAELITRLIETDQFEYVNLHYHFFESYTASGDGAFGGNLQNVRLLNEKDMGVFIISPYDKGGRLYAPSRKLRSLTLPDLEPITFGSLWLFNHANLDEEKSAIHTITIGAARPSDLDEPACAAFLQNLKKDETMQKVQIVTKRLRDAEVEALGDKWLRNWYEGVPNCMTENDVYQFGQILSLHNGIKAWGLLDYAKDRYRTFDGNLNRWDFTITNKENIAKIGSMWGYMPGIATEIGKDYSKYFAGISEDRRNEVLKALQFTFNYCSKESEEKDAEVPDDWKTAYDMRPWNAFPERS